MRSKFKKGGQVDWANILAMLMDSIDDIYNVNKVVSIVGGFNDVSGRRIFVCCGPVV